MSIFITSPVTEKDYLEYFQFRWKMLREPLGQTFGTHQFFFASPSRAFRQALHLDPHQWLALRGLGSLEASAGRKKEALELMRVASRLAPHDRKLKLKVAQLLESLGAFAEAHVHFRSATILDPEDAQAFFW